MLQNLALGALGIEAGRSCGFVAGSGFGTSSGLVLGYSSTSCPVGCVHADIAVTVCPCRTASLCDAAAAAAAAATTTTSAAARLFLLLRDHGACACVYVFLAVRGRRGRKGLAGQGRSNATERAAAGRVKKVASPVLPDAGFVDGLKEMWG